MALSRHAGFFASLQRVEDRLALEKKDEGEQHEQSTDSMTAAASPLVLLDHPATTTAADDSSGPALDFLSLTRHDEYTQTQETEEDDGGDIERLMALLGLTPPPKRDDGGGGGCECDCSGGDGFRAKVVGVVGPKCSGEKKRLDAWIQHFYSSEGREPARLAHLLLAKYSADADGRAFPPTVKDFFERDPPYNH